MKAQALLPLFAAVAVAAAGVENPLRPTASVGGAYGIIGGVEPAPAPPTTDGCVDGCPCNGTGKERSGDGIISFPCRCPDSCKCKGGSGDAGDSCCGGDEVVKPVRMPGPRWNWEGLNSPSDNFMRSHLLQDHGVDATGWSREEMQAAHDNLHNGHGAMGATFRDDCPDGTCPAPSSAGSKSGNCPTGNCPTSSSGSRRRGLFGRWR